MEHRAAKMELGMGMAQRRSQVILPRAANRLRMLRVRRGDGGRGEVGRWEHACVFVHLFLLREGAAVFEGLLAEGGGDLRRKGVNAKGKGATPRGQSSMGVLATG